MSPKTAGRMVECVKHLSMLSRICNSDDCRSCDQSNGISLFSATPKGFNSAIIINDHPFAYPDCTIGVSVRPSEVIKSW